MDVSPRSLTPVSAPSATGSDPAGEPVAGARPTRGSRGARVRGLLLAAVVLGALGFVVLRGLGNATLFFYNADEALAQRQELGRDRIRLQGNVLDGTIERSNGLANFVVSFAGADVDVAHQGEIPQLFQPGIPVVLEGRWEGNVFASDRMLVKHSEVYVEQNADRVGDYEPANTSVEP